MEHPPHVDGESTRGALGLGQSTATRIYCLFYIAYYSTPILFALLADSVLGRYWSLFAGTAMFCLGCFVITFTSLPSMVARGWGVPGLVLSMVLIALGGGGVRVVMVPFLVDQYGESGPSIRTLPSGELVRIDRDLTLQYICSLNYW